MQNNHRSGRSLWLIRLIVAGLAILAGITLRRRTALAPGAPPAAYPDQARFTPNTRSASETPAAEQKPAAQVEAPSAPESATPAEASSSDPNFDWSSIDTSDADIELVAGIPSPSITARFAHLVDTNADGIFSAEEVAAANAALDTDGDGTISAAELEAAGLTGLDTDGDGAIDAGELAEANADAAWDESGDAPIPAALPEGATLTGDGVLKVEKGTHDCPGNYPIKGNGSSRIYHVPGSPSYAATIPEFCFSTEEVAQAQGFRPRRA